MYNTREGLRISMELLPQMMTNETASAELEDMKVFHGTVHMATLAVCTVLVIFVLMLGCVGNGMVLLAAIRSKKLRSNFDVIIFNLAAADFIMSMFLAPIFMFLLFSDPPTSQLFCGSTLFLGTICGLISLLSMFVVALHRLGRITGHIKASLRTSHIASALAFIWIVSLAISMSGTLFISLEWKDGFRNCQRIINGNDRRTHNFVLFFMAPVCVLCFFVITFAYSMIAYTVQNQLVLKQASPIYRKCNEAYENHAELLKRTRVPNSRETSGPNQTRTERENKALTMCVVVVMTTLLCWGPVIVSQFIELMAGESIILYQVKLCGIALVFLNSALNPFIYSHHSGKIRRKYTKFIRKTFRCDMVDRVRTWRINVESNRFRSSNCEQDTNSLHITPPKHPLIKPERFGDVRGKRPLRTYTHNLLFGAHLNHNTEITGNRIFNPGQCPHSKECHNGRVVCSKNRN